MIKDNEIIESLKICANGMTCKGCKINPKRGNYGYCTNLAINAALDLINRQKAEIERLEYTLLGVMHSVDKWLEGEELEQDEVNRAITMREKTLQIVEEKQAEIERLNETKDEWKLSAINKARRVDELTNEIAKLKFSSMIGATRAEAIKEFAERLKASSCIRYVDEMTGEVYQMIISGSTIDYLVKKMTEGV